MLFVLPVTRADYKLAETTASLIDLFGGVRPHKILLAFAASCPGPSRKKIEKKLAASVDNLVSYDLETKDERGWPRSANSVFAEVARVVAERKADGEKGWYFFEADNTPMCPEWASRLDREYRMSHMPYMGVINETHRGLGVSHRVDGSHLVGTSIYPADFFHSCRLAKHLTAIIDPFDVALQWEVVPQAHPTNQILHNWSSSKYVRDPKTGSISCQTSRWGGLTYPIPSDHTYSVVHGCKDGSLAKLVAAAFKA